jgi:hypothetical protein
MTAGAGSLTVACQVSGGVMRTLLLSALAPGWPFSTLLVVNTISPGLAPG